MSDHPGIVERIETKVLYLDKIGHDWLVRVKETGQPLCIVRDYFFKQPHGAFTVATVIGEALEKKEEIEL